MCEFAPTARTRIYRGAAKACYDKDTICGILDDIPECTIAICDPATGLPRQMVTTHWRVDDALYIHGGQGSSFYKALVAGAPVAVSVAATDGLVLARSAFDTSINYRSVTIYGSFEPVRERDAQLALLEAFYERLLPGRWQEIRRPSDKEMAATYVLRLPLVEAVAKISAGEPDDCNEAPEVWGGVRTRLHGWGRIEADSASRDMPLPPSVRKLARD
jgi:uncharacterized protein